jgi:hypothetical protein
MTHLRSSRFRPRLVAVLAALLLVLAACGDDSGGDGDGAALSEADFIAAYSSICTGVTEEVNALAPGSLEEAREAATEAQEIVADGVAELEALEPPADIADEVEQGTASLAATEEIFGELSGVESEDEFSEVGAGVDESLAEARAVLEPVGIDCGIEAGGDDDESSSGGSSDAVPAAEPASALSDYGSDDVLDALADDCEAGDFDACDTLFNESPVGSAYEEYGDSCGGRNEPGGFCTTIYG